MIKKLHLYAIACVLMIQSLSAQENFKLMFYNVLNFPLETAVPNRLQYLEVILDDYQPDLFMVCELNNQAGANTILTSLQFINPDYQSAVFEFNTSDDSGSNQNNLQQLMYYDSSKFSLESQAIVTTIFRDFNHYRLQLNTVNQDTNPVILDVIVCHLKASQGESNENFRLQMAQDLTTYLNTFPANSNIVLSGDFNVYRSSEPAFQEFIDADNNNVIKFEDPADRIGNWHTNSSFIDVFTQSTRTQTGLGGSTGGFDDRFDFIMTSSFMIDNPELSFVPNTYEVYGNNSNSQCFNRAINSSDCAGADFSFNIREALYNFSDHLPVTLELQTNQTLLSIDDFLIEEAISISGTNLVKDLLRINIKPDLQNGLSLSLYNSIGQLIKTVDVNNSLIGIDTSQFANGIYYITSSKFQFKPLKFVVAH